MFATVEAASRGRTGENYVFIEKDEEHFANIVDIVCISVTNNNTMTTKTLVRHSKANCMHKSLS